MMTSSLSDKYSVTGTERELKKAVMAVATSQSKGYEALKEELFKVFEQDMPIYRKKPTTDCAMKSVRELKLKFGEQKVIANPYK